MKDVSLNLYDAVFADFIPSDPAVYYLGAALSYGRLRSETDALARALKADGVCAGEVVTVALPNMPAAIELLYALRKLGCIVSFVHPLLPPAGLRSVMRRTGSTRLFALDASAARFDATFADVEITACSPSDHLPALKKCAYRIADRTPRQKRRFSDLLARGKKLPADPAPAVGGGEAPSVYLHSGGTTGDPKTIVLCDRALNCLAYRGYEIVGTDREGARGAAMLAVLPMFHGFGLCMCVHTMLSLGAVSALVPRFRPKDVCGILARCRVRFVAGVPAMYYKLLACRAFRGRKLASLTFAFCGGDSMPLALKERFDRAMEKNGSPCRMFEGYGLTETVTVCAVNTPARNKPGSVGRMLDGMLARIADPDTGAVLGAGEEGELQVSCDTQMLGYLGDPAATASAVVTDADGTQWVKTGDLCSMDADGFITFRQRLKRIVKVNGISVFPSEIEDVAAAEPDVDGACALGVPDETRGARIRLYVATRLTGERRDDLRRRLEARLTAVLPRWAMPREIVLRDSLPLTIIGKVDFRALEAELHGGS